MEIQPSSSKSNILSTKLHNEGFANSKQDKAMSEIWNSLEKAAMKFAMTQDILNEEIPEYLRDDKSEMPSSNGAITDYNVSGNRYSMGNASSQPLEGNTANMVHGDEN